MLDVKMDVTKLKAEHFPIFLPFRKGETPAPTFLRWGPKKKRKRRKKEKERQNKGKEEEKKEGKKKEKEGERRKRRRKKKRKKKERHIFRKHKRRPRLPLLVILRTLPIGLA